MKIPLTPIELLLIAMDLSLKVAILLLKSPVVQDQEHLLLVATLALSLATMTLGIITAMLIAITQITTVCLTVAESLDTMDPILDVTTEVDQESLMTATPCILLHLHLAVTVTMSMITV
jgi:hypothetical protein